MPGGTAASQSLLATGNWSRIRVDEDGIYSLSYEDLAGLGISNPGSVRLYGHGGGMLPMQNMADRLDDLQENALYLDDGGDGTFGPGDRILFYGRSPHTWNMSMVPGAQRLSPSSHSSWHAMHTPSTQYKPSWHSLKQAPQ